MSTTNLQTELPRSDDTGRDTRSYIFDAFINPDLQAVCAVAAIGLLLTICLARAFPINDVIGLIGQID